MKKFLKVLYMVLILLFMYAPIFTLVVYSFFDVNTVSFQDLLVTPFSLELYKKLFTDSALMKIVFDTLLLALIVAVLSVILGTTVAIGIFYSKKRAGKTLSAVSRIPVINAEIVTAVSIALLFTAIFTQSRSFFAMIIGHMVLTTPFVVLSVLPKLQQMDPNMYEAALDLGASPTRALWTVVIPEILPGIVSGFMLAITLSLDDYIVSAYTQPAGIKTISTYVYTAISKSGTNSSLPALRALSAIIFVVITAVVIINNVVSNKKAKKEVKA